MEDKREEWGSKLGFILAAVGSAVGLGNIWRFPYVAYENGGGAFLIPYFVAIFTAGIPLLILEYGMGHKYKGSTPLAIARGKKSWEWLGWWPTISAFIILIYYSMILSWSTNYLGLSFSKGWGSDTNTFFHNNFLNLSNSPLELGGIVWYILLGIAFVWIVNWFICYKGIKGGIEKANKILLPMLVVIMIIIAVRSVNLEGAIKGLNTLFTPDWSMVMEPKVWIAAYGQVFFSLSLAMGIMITYSSYLPKKTDINNSAFMTAFANCGFEFLSAIAVFAILGYMATAQGVSVSEVVSSGVGLAFVVFPQVFTTMGSIGTLLGTLFFLCLIFAGITSSVSLTQAVAAPFQDKFGWNRNKVVTTICLIGFLISTLFATGAGLYLLDIIDNFINNYGIVVVGLLEVILIGWIITPEKIRIHTNGVSYFSIGKWWDVVVKYVTPSILIFMLVQSLLTEIKTPYGGYNLSELLLYGWSVIAFGIISALILSKKPWKDKQIEDYISE
ncbi:sodium-dependent transporter [Clostridium sardiniense]|uniref:sodium-dependent transporter n=1 Tax=Clostridium sardiniense TaxID=29369 RepID=UPI00195D92C0|nr:sodium-dependent transporter [Clostridium sardiniense]MBM7833857.1 NSS family neurotransmitter:Na+ symporter [Clostridium sardiniense]